MDETTIEKLEIKLKAARQDFGDITLRDAHKIVNSAAGSIETMIIESNSSFSKPTAAFLINLAGRMRTETEKALGPQPGFSYRKSKLHGSDK
jgi:hypothetical protein